MRIDLHMNHIQLALFDPRVMHLFAVLPCSVSPTRDGSLIQSVGMDNGLEGASIGKPRHDKHNQFCRLPSSCKHRAALAPERLSAHLPSIARTLSTVDDDIALPHLPSCFATHIRAEVLGSVHRFCLCLHTLQNRRWTLIFQSVQDSFPPVHGALPLYHG